MVKRLLIPLFILLFFTLRLSAQSPTKIVGSVQGTDGAALNSVTVLLFKAKNSALMKTKISDTRGNYEISVEQKGNYYITASCSGYTSVSSAIFTITKEGDFFYVPAISLSPITKEMQGITVTGNYTKPMVEVTAGKTVLNVENSINATGSNAFELLQKSPGVTTDKDDNITVKGKNGVRIYIDGRQTQMSNDDLPTYLKSINSADIQSIEIISNPSAQYDASGNAGIINIKLKKSTKNGINGSVSLGLNYGNTFKTPESFSFNYRNKKINFFTNYSFYWGNLQENLFLYRNQSDSIFNQTNQRNVQNRIHNIKTGLDYFINPKSTIGVIATINLDKNTDAAKGYTLIGPVGSNPIDSLYAQNIMPGNVINTDYNINYRYADTTGHILTFDADYGLYENNKMSYQPNSYYDIVSDTFLYSNIYNNITSVNINIYTAKLDYTTPFKKGKLEFGGKTSFVTTSNIYNVYNVVNYMARFDSVQSNYFKYQENVNALYVNYNRPINKKWTLQGGLRVENTYSKGQLTRYSSLPMPEDSVTHNYTDFFPSASVTYVANNDNTFNLSFSRRIDRPNYKYLNPFETRIDELTYEKGNAFLVPQYTNSIELTHTFKNKFNTTFSFSHVQDFSAQIIDTIGKSASFLTPKNLASQNILNLNFSLPLKITKWWNIYANINGYTSSYKGNIDAAMIDLQVTSYSLYMEQTFSFLGNYTGEITGYYDGPSIWQGTFMSTPMGGLDIGLQRKLLHNKAAIKLSCSDLFNSIHWSAISNYNGAYVNASGNWESHLLKLNFTYHFGNSQVNQSQHHTASEDENKRTGTSSGLGGN
jgi:iron complex outermembrane receptor protein